ncbi:MAG: hypothetical protein JXN60_02550 [Lentisphaerae bacterium]|nr:hypothetical protein [Lentisphaerota bacterium]
MKIVHILGAAVLSAVVSTSAFAGGFDFKSAGGNTGKWAYGDAASFGGAEANGKSGETYSESGANTETSLKHGYFGTTTSSSSGSGNLSQFTSTYGSGHAQSHSSAVAGSGVGTGAGFKFGDFNPDGKKKP